MWEWSRTVAERAAAASWTNWQTRGLKPTAIEREFSTEPVEREASGGVFADVDSSEDMDVFTVARTNVYGIALQAPFAEYDLIG